MANAYSGTLQLPLPSEELWKQKLTNQSPFRHLFVAEVNGKVVAITGLMLEQNVRRKHVGSLGISVHDDYANKGIGTALMSKVIDIADNWMALLRLELTVFDDNKAAIKLYEKLGFEKEGVHKQYAFRNGRYCDVIAMARIKGTV
ncbi:GNAT family N-acetyltransferase [Reinekea forsetii]|nr:GNAT family N-acetyltransferase [Reinekea forsetii]